MRKCDHFRDLILTDYLDGELNKVLSGNVESHLLDCSDCRLFLKEVKSNAALPLRQVSRQPVPAELWDMISKDLNSEDQKTYPFMELVDRLKVFFVFPKMVPVFASLAAMFLAGSLTLNTIHLQQAKAKDQGEYLISLLSPTDALTDNNEGKTPIEQYFL